MSTVWETRDRLLVEQLERLVKKLSGEEQIEPAEVMEQAVRLLTGVIALLRQHRVNKRGQCQCCGCTRWVWRFWRRRPRCTVYRAVGFVFHQHLDVVWWQLLGELGQRISLEEARKWVVEWRRRDHGGQ
ncbi:MAG: hypothetical protein ABIZ05_02060 [Pseudonocardiaceae bacterium]